MMVCFIIGAILGILYQLMGLVGALKEHVCMMTFYAVLQILGTFSTAIGCFTFSVYFTPSLVWSVIGSVVIILFLRDLRAIKYGPQPGQTYYA